MFCLHKDSVCTWLRALSVATAIVTGTVSSAFSQSSPTLRIGMLTDMSSAYSDLSGKSSIAAAQMAIDDFGGEVLGRKIELLTADHQMKPSVGSAIATEWFDRDGVEAIFSVPASSVAMAVQEIVRNRPEKVVIQTIASTSDLSGKACAPNSIHWAPDFYALGSSVSAFVSANGSNNSFVLIPDTAAGEPALNSAKAGIGRAGSKLIGSVRVPPASGDVSSFVLQAQASGANNLLIGFGGSDMVNVVKAATQFGLKDSGMSVVSLGLYATDIDAMGLELASGITFSTPFYPLMNEEAAAWTKRFKEKTGRLPAFSHVSEYEAVTHYLHAVQQAGSQEASKVIPAMRALPVNSFAIKNGVIRADNQLIRPIYIGKVKTAEQSKQPEDYMDLLATITPDEAFSPLKDSACPLVTN